MIKYIVGIIAIIVWLLILRVLRKADLRFWRFLIGAAGLFIICLVFLMPILTEPLARIVALIASIPGKITGIFSAYYKYGTIMIDSSMGSISLKIDFECSGIIEIIAFVSLLTFYRVYTVLERIWVGIIGVLCIICANALRIIVICIMIYFGGVESYYVAHTFVGRIVFYGLSVAIYFYVFTKPQIMKQKVGSFKYDVDK